MSENANVVNAVSQDIVDDIAEAKKLYAIYKSGGKAALVASLPEVVELAKKDFVDVKAALPSIKAGYKTTEFWLTAGLVVVNGGFTVITGKTIPVDLNVVLGGVIAVYTAVRGLLKK